MFDSHHIEHTTRGSLLLDALSYLGRSDMVFDGDLNRTFQNSTAASFALTSYITSYLDQGLVWNEILAELSIETQTSINEGYSSSSNEPGAWYYMHIIAQSYAAAIDLCLSNLEIFSANIIYSIVFYFMDYVLNELTVSNTMSFIDAFDYDEHHDYSDFFEDNGSNLCIFMNAYILIHELYYMGVIDSLNIKEFTLKMNQSFNLSVIRSEGSTFTLIPYMSSPELFSSL